MMRARAAVGWRAWPVLQLLIFSLNAAASDVHVVTNGEELVKQLQLWAAQDQPVELLITQNLTAPDDAYIEEGRQISRALKLGPGLTITGIGRPVLDLRNSRNVLSSVVSRSLRLRNVIIVNGCVGWGEMLSASTVQCNAHARALQLTAAAHGSFG